MLEEVVLLEEDPHFYHFDLTRTSPARSENRNAFAFRRLSPLLSYKRVAMGPNACQLSVKFEAICQ